MTKSGSGRAVRVLVVVSVVAVGAVLLMNWPSAPRRTGSPGGLRSGSAAKFNVLLVTLDTTRADHLGCYGHDPALTPVLDNLAEAGVRFGDTVTTAPVTLPAHASILTGLYPPKHGVRNNAEFRLAPEHATLAEVLRENGYQTAAFVSTFVLDRRFGLEQGFDHYDDQMEAPAQGFGQDLERSAEATTDAAKAWFAARKDDRPFFAWVHYYDPHAPYMRHRPPPEGILRLFENPYDSEIAYMDYHLGRLLETLDANHLRERTLVVVVGDHGESLGEHNEVGHSHTVYDAVMRVPLILWSPTLIPERDVVDQEVTSVTDVFPTVLDLLGISQANECDGVTLLKSREIAERTVYMESMVTYLDNGWAPLHALRQHERKFILAPRSEYYDLRKDPRELKNLYADRSGGHLEACAGLEGELKERLAEGPSAAEVASGAETLDPETLRRLQSLGYLAGSEPEENTGQLDPKDMLVNWEKTGQAKQLSAEGDHAAAIAILEEVLADWPNDRKVLHRLGMTYHRMGRVREAEEVLKKALAIKPAAEVCVLLAQIVLVDGRLDEAEQLLQLGQSVDPQHGGVLIVRGDLFAKRGQFEDALAAYAEAKRVDPYRASVVADESTARLRAFMEQSQKTGP